MANENKMKTFKVTIEGATTMLQNQLDHELINEFKKVKKQDYEKWEDENWKRKAYIQKEGKGENTKDAEGKEIIIIPANNIHSMLCNAAKKYNEKPPKHIGRTWTDYVKSSVIIEDVTPLKYSKMTPFGAMVNANPSSRNKSRVWKIRPQFSDWELTFYVKDTSAQLSEEDMRGIIKAGGLFVGLGDYRPQYGRFFVKKIVMEEISI